MHVDADGAVAGLGAREEKSIRIPYPGNAKSEHDLSVRYKPLEPLEFGTNHSSRSWIISKVEFLWEILRECISVCLCAWANEYA